MEELEKLRRKAPVIRELVKAGYFDTEEKEVLRKLGLLGG